LRAVEDDQLKEVASPVRTEDEVASRVLTDLLDDKGILECMLHVPLGDPMARGRAEDLHLT